MSSHTKTIEQLINKTQQKLRRQSLEEELKQILDQIKQTYFEYLSSLKFHNLNNHLSYKQTARHIQTKHHSPQNTTFNAPHYYDVDQSHFMEADTYQHEKQSISEFELKNYSFEQQLSIQNKGYMSFVRLLNNLKQLQDYNHLLRSVVMNCEENKPLQKQQNQLMEDLKKLELQIPIAYFGKKP